jgi:Zn-dependent protease with chaperone function
MAATGFVTHVRDAHRAVAWLIAAYVVAFELIGGLAAMIVIPFWDPTRMLLADPLGYFARYGLPMALIALAMFAWLYRSHAQTVMRALKVADASRIGEARFIRIAEEQCIAQGLRAPRFGIIEVPQPNALAVGDGPERGLIAVTRGLLDHLDDEELAAVIAHEVAHIRGGDTRILAANHALMRTAVLLQVRNVLRFEDWRQLLIPLLLPPMMVIFLLSGFITMCSMKLAREARRGINLSRDFIADAAAVRATHFPDALIGALHKLDGRGRFENSDGYEDILFEGRSTGDGGSHPDMAERIAALHRLAGSMIDLNRVRRDTRKVDFASGGAGFRRPLGGFGRRGLDPAAVLAARGAGLAIPAPPPPPVREKPPMMGNDEALKLMLTDYPAYKRHLAHCTDYYEWRESDGRNLFGLKPELRLPVAACFAFLLALYWPGDGDYRKFAYKFSPSAWADVSVRTQGTFCSGPSYPDGKCRD